jgi:Mn2+/Fe2+ NRAMP family transporter
MELDDLKQSWQQEEPKKIKNTDIMDIIHHKSYGPIAALKRAFLKQIRVMIIVPILVIFVNVKDWDKALTSVLLWSYVLFCLGVIAFTYANYRIVSKMEGMDERVKTTLQEQVALLERRLRRNKIGVRLAGLYFVVLLEVLPYFQHFKMLDTWHSLSPLYRFSAYAAFLLFQYFISRLVMQRKFGHHLDYLKSLVKEMQD